MSLSNATPKLSQKTYFDVVDLWGNDFHDALTERATYAAHHPALEKDRRVITKHLRANDAMEGTILLYVEEIFEDIRKRGYNDELHYQALCDGYQDWNDEEPVSAWRPLGGVPPLPDLPPARKPGPALKPGRAVQFLEKAIAKLDAGIAEKDTDKDRHEEEEHPALREEGSKDKGKKKEKEKGKEKEKEKALDKGKGGLESDQTENGNGNGQKNGKGKNGRAPATRAAPSTSGKGGGSRIKSSPTVDDDDQYEEDQPVNEERCERCTRLDSPCGARFDKRGARLVCAECKTGKFKCAYPSQENTSKPKRAPRKPKVVAAGAAGEYAGKSSFFGVVSTLTPLQCSRPGCRRNSQRSSTATLRRTTSSLSAWPISRPSFDRSKVRTRASGFGTVSTSIPSGTPCSEVVRRRRT
jgi:hypothetical protein